MESEKWSALKAWFHANYKSLPKDVANAIETLIEEREKEGSIEECEECGHDLTGEQIADGETVCHRCAGEPYDEDEY